MIRSGSRSIRKLRLFIISDSSERLGWMRASLAVDEIDITSAISPEEFNRACAGRHDLAVIDVGPASLGEMLRGLRASAGHAEISVLVKMSRLAAEPDLAGLLPKYRAMPCSRDELVTLVRHRIASIPGRHETRRGL